MKTWRAERARGPTHAFAPPREQSHRRTALPPRQLILGFKNLRQRPASRAPQSRWRRGRSRRRCARRASARSAPRAFCRADRPARTPRRRERTWLLRALASVAPNQGYAAATYRRRVVRSKRKWWECPASPWRRRPGKGAPILGRAAGAARRLGNEGFEADHVEGRDETPKRFGHWVDFLAQPRKQSALDMVPAGLHGVQGIVGHACCHESGR